MKDEIRTVVKMENASGSDGRVEAWRRDLGERVKCPKGEVEADVNSTRRGRLKELAERRKEFVG